jgi:hypothetical protein
MQYHRYPALMVRNMNIKIVDPIKWVSSRPEQFFRCAEPRPTHLLIYIMGDIIELGKGDCLIRRDGEWFVIGSDSDWLGHEKYSVLELFNHVVPAPAHGEHSMRGEILVNVYASDVAFIDSGNISEVKGSAPPSTALEKAADMQQAIVFRF